MSRKYNKSLNDYMELKWFIRLLFLNSIIGIEDLERKISASDLNVELSKGRSHGNEKHGERHQILNNGHSIGHPDLSFQHNIYLTHKQQCKWLKEAGAAASNISTTFRLGLTHFNTEICAIHINPTKRNLPLIWIDANMVARDWIASATTLSIIDKILFSKEAIKLRRNYRFVIVPNLNPDGYIHTFKQNRNWMKNRKPIQNNTECVGVYINHNFDAGLQDGNRCGVCNDNYAGHWCFSEAESLSVWSALDKLSPISMLFSLHSFGQRWLLPFACCPDNPNNFNEMKRVAEIAVKEIFKINKMSFEVGKGSDLLGGFYSGSLYDWAVMSYNVSYSYNILLRPPTSGSGGYILDASNIVPSGNEMFAGISAAILNARLP